MKTAIDKVLCGKERVFNRRFLALCNHFMIETSACTPAAPWEKGQIENQVGNVREWFFTPRQKFDNLTDLNHYLRACCEAHAEQSAHPNYKDKTIAQVFEQEHAALLPLASPFNAYHEHEVRVSFLSLIAYDRNRYSVPCDYVGQQVTLRAYANQLIIVAKGKIIAEHTRVFGRDHISYNFLHYISVLSRKPGALRNGAPFQDDCL